MKTKMKSHSGAKKRFRRTGTGKLVRRKAGRRHLLTGKARDRKRRLKGTVVVLHDIDSYAEPDPSAIMMTVR